MKSMYVPYMIAHDNGKIIGIGRATLELDDSAVKDEQFVEDVCDALLKGALAKYPDVKRVHVIPMDFIWLDDYYRR